MTDPALTGEGPRKHWRVAIQESPVNAAKRVGKVHPKQVNYWLMVIGKEPRLNRGYAMVKVYAGFGQQEEVPFHAADLFEDWVPVEEGDKDLRFLESMFTGQGPWVGIPRWEARYGVKLCPNCNPIPPSPLHYLAMQSEEDKNG